MEDTSIWPQVARVGVGLAVLGLALGAAWYLGKSPARRRRLIWNMASLLPWLVAAWFLAAIAGCLELVSRIGSSSGDPAMFLLIGGLGFPVFLPLSVYVRNRIRRYLQPGDR